MNKEQTDKLELLGTLLSGEIDRVNKLISIVKELNDRVEALERDQHRSNKYNSMRNELTYLHNEIRDVQKLLGMDGSEPKLKDKYEYH
jgi:hypothetical protein